MPFVDSMDIEGVSQETPILHNKRPLGHIGWHGRLACVGHEVTKEGPGLRGLAGHPWRAVRSRGTRVEDSPQEGSCASGGRM